MDVSELLDPEIAKAVETIGSDDIGPDDLAMLRSHVDQPLSDAVKRTDHLVTGISDIAVRVHRPEGFEGALPCVYSMHGGGYVIGTYAMDDGMFDELCPRLGIVGVSVDYRLAPETPYPGPLDDCYRGLRWIQENAERLSVDPTRICVTGVSAGGGLAAALALLARDRGEVPIRCQLLDAPMLDDRQITPSSQQDGLPVWSRKSNEFGWRSYLGVLYGRDDLPHTAAAARATDLAGLPPAFVSVGAVDGFRDESVDYGIRLNQAGVPCDLHVYAGAPHGYQMAVNSPITKQSRRDVEAWLQRQLL